MQNLNISDLKNITDILSAYVSNNKVPLGELTMTFKTIVDSYKNLDIQVLQPQLQHQSHDIPASHDVAANSDIVVPGIVRGIAAYQGMKPKVPVSKSVKEDTIICLIDGLPFKSLTKHLQSKYGLTPEQYRSVFNLPETYPMVTPLYSRVRSDIARRTRLGHKIDPTPAMKRKASKAQARVTAH